MALGENNLGFCFGLHDQLHTWQLLVLCFLFLQSLAAMDDSEASMSEMIDDEPVEMEMGPPDHGDSDMDNAGWFMFEPQESSACELTATAASQPLLPTQEDDFSIQAAPSWRRSTRASHAGLVELTAHHGGDGIAPKVHRPLHLRSCLRQSPYQMGLLA